MIQGEIMKNLYKKKARKESDLFLIEGKKYILEIPMDWEIVKYIISKSFADTNNLSQFSNRANIEIVKDSIFKQYSDTVTPQGIIAIVRQKAYEVKKILSKNALILIGENLQDPGTIGTLARTATAAGASGFVLTKGSCEIYSPKVIRSSAGAILRLPFITDIDINSIIEILKQNNIKIIACHPRDGQFSCDMKESCAIIIGNESRGLTNIALTLADEIITLPMTNETESLNAGISGSIILYEAVRQRY